MTETTDHELMLRIRNRDDTAMAEVYKRYGGAVFALAARILGDRQLAEDIAQEVFLHLWNSAADFDPQRGKLRTLLMTRTHGRCVDVIRSRNARSDREAKAADDRSTKDADAIDSQLTTLTEAELVRTAVDSLPVEERTVLQLAYFGANTYREVATILSLPEGTVKTRMRSALKRLRTDLHEDFFSSEPSEPPSPSSFSTCSSTCSSTDDSSDSKAHS
jgi:RNA polymerase sigma-70 factor, ECF subfamily